MNPHTNLLNDPNFLDALHKLHLKVYANRLAEWENMLSITDVYYENEDMNTEMERLFGFPVYEEHKAMLRKAMTQSRFRGCTAEQVIAIMSKEEKAEELRNNNTSTKKSPNPPSQKFTNSSLSFGPSTSVNTVQVPSNKVFPHQQTYTPSASRFVGPHNTTPTYCGEYNGHPQCDKNYVSAAQLRDDTSKQQTVNVPSCLYQSRISDIAVNPGQSFFTENMNSYLTTSANQQVVEPQHQAPCHPRLHRTSSTLVNSEQASSCYDATTMEKSPALYSVVLKKQSPVSAKEPSGFMNLSSVQSNSFRNSNSDTDFNDNKLRCGTNYYRQIKK